MGIEIGSVRRGKRYTITLRGKPVADLVPSEAAEKSEPAAAVEAMRAVRKVRGIKGNAIGSWIAEGRR